MKTIVVGCGKIGTTVLASLIAEGHDAVAIDNAPQVISDITNIYDAIGVCGSGTDCEILSDAGVETADLFIAVTGSDEVNMLSCFIASQMGARHTVARIRNPEYNEGNLEFLRGRLGLSMVINPERTVARRLFNVLKLPAAAQVETFSGRHVEMVELKLKQDSALDGVKLSELRKKFPYKFLICAVQRDDEVTVPDGGFVLRSGDKIGITAPPSEVVKLLRGLNILQKQSRSVMILGAGTTSYYLSKLLLSEGFSVKIVEKDADRCRIIAENLPEAVVIHGDGAQRELLLEEGLPRMDAFVTLTGMDEENILVSYFAASCKVPKVIAKINRDEFSPVAEQLGLETLVSPLKTVSNVIVRYARALESSRDSSVESLYRIFDGKAEVLEFTVGDDCELMNIPLKELKLKSNTLIGGIIRGSTSIIPSGNDVVCAGDKVIVLTAGHRVNALSEIVQ